MRYVEAGEGSAGRAGHGVPPIMTVCSQSTCTRQRHHPLWPDPDTASPDCLLIE